MVSSDYALTRIREEPILLALYTYWEGVRGGKDVPDRRDIDPVDMPRFILPHLALTEVDDDMRMKVRLVGTEIVRAHRQDTTGKFATEYMQGEYLDYVTSLYAQLRASRLPLFSESIFRHADTHLQTSRLILPLTLGGTEVRIGMMAQIFHHIGAQPVSPMMVPIDVGALEIVNQITLSRVT
jgi:hypothetical protein